MSRNDDYTTGHLLDFLYHQKYYKLNSLDLSRQANKSISQRINFTGKLEEDDGAATFFIAEKKCSKLFFRFINDNSNINQWFPIQVQLLAMYRGELSAVIIHLMSKCL